MAFKIYPHNQHSRSARALSRALGGRVLLREGSRYRPNRRNVHINWGSSNAPDFVTLNHDTSITNKLTFFQTMEGREWLPPFWTSRDDIPDDAFPVVCRTLLTSHSGRGIVIANSREELVDARLYVQYKKKADEYRIHLGLNETGLTTRVIDIQQKRKRREAEDVNYQIRNHENGYVYCREDANPPEAVRNAAIECFNLSGLCFGAVDVIYNRHYGQAWVLEINSAPGLEGTTVERYKEYFEREFG